MAEEFPDVLFSVVAVAVKKKLNALREGPSLDVDEVATAGAAGGDNVSVLVQLAPHALTFLSGVIVAWLARPRASIEIDGEKVKGSGISPSFAEELLSQSLERHARRKGKAKRALSRWCFPAALSVGCKPPIRDIVGSRMSRRCEGMPAR